MSQDKQTVTQRHYFSGRKRLWLLAWSLIRLAILLPIWLISLVLVILGWALSPWGTSVLLDQAEQRGWVQLEDHQGSLFERLKLEGFGLDVAGVSISLGEFELAWAEDCVLSGRLCIDTLRAVDADVRLSTGGDTSEKEQQASAPLQEIRLPFPVELRELVLENMDIRLADGTRIRWESFTSAISAEESLIRIAPTHLERSQVYLPASPGVLLADAQDSPLSSSAIDAAIELQSPLETDNQGTPAEAIANREPIELPAISLPISLELPAFSVNEFTLSGVTEYTVNNVQLGLTARDSQITLSQLDVTTPDVSAQLSAEVELQEDYPLNAQLDAQLFLPEIMPELAGEEISLRLAICSDPSNVRVSLSS